MSLPKNQDRAKLLFIFRSKHAQEDKEVQALLLRRVFGLIACLTLNRHMIPIRHRTLQTNQLIQYMNRRIEAVISRN